MFLAWVRSSAQIDHDKLGLGSNEKLATAVVLSIFVYIVPSDEILVVSDIF